MECLQAECDDLKRERSSYQPAEWQDRELESVLQENQLLKGKVCALGRSLLYGVSLIQWLYHTVLVAYLSTEPLLSFETT